MRTPGSGRAAGTGNKASAEIKEAMRAEFPNNVAKLKALRDNPDTPPSVQHDVVKTMLAYGYGRPSSDINVQVSNAAPDYLGWATQDELAQLQTLLSTMQRRMLAGEAKPLPGVLDVQPVPNRDRGLLPGRALAQGE